MSIFYNFATLLHICPLKGLKNPHFPLLLSLFRPGFVPPGRRPSVDFQSQRQTHKLHLSLPALLMVVAVETMFADDLIADFFSLVEGHML